MPRLPGLSIRGSGRRRGERDCRPQDATSEAAAMPAQRQAGALWQANRPQAGPPPLTGPSDRDAASSGTRLT
jgi:hypothetical protein